MIATLRMSGRVRVWAISAYCSTPALRVYAFRRPSPSELAPETALAACERVDRRTEGGGVEVGPRRGGRPELGVRALVEQEVREPQLPAGAHDEVRVGQAGGPQPRRDRVFVDPLRVEPARGDVSGERAASVAQLGSRAVVQRDRELQRSAVDGALFEACERGRDGGRQAVAAPDRSDAHAARRERGGLLAGEGGREPEEPVDLQARTEPVLFGERVDGEHRDARAQGRVDGALERRDPAAVAFERRETVLLSPAAVAVHDDRDVARDGGGEGCALDHGCVAMRGAAPPSAWRWTPRTTLSSSSTY